MDKEQVKKTSEKTDVSPSDIRKLKRAEKKRKKFEKKELKRLKKEHAARAAIVPPSKRPIICPPDCSDAAKKHVYLGMLCRMITIFVAVVGLSLFVSEAFGFDMTPEYLAQKAIKNYGGITADAGLGFIALWALVFVALFALPAFWKYGAFITVPAVAAAIVVPALPNPVTYFYEAALTVYNGALGHMKYMGFYAIDLNRVEVAHTADSPEGYARTMVMLFTLLTAAIFVPAMVKRARIILPGIYSGGILIFLFVYNLSRSNWALAFVAAAFCALIIMYVFDRIYIAAPAPDATDESGNVFGETDAPSLPEKLLNKKASKEEKKAKKLAAKAEKKARKQGKKITVDQEITEYFADAPERPAKKQKVHLTPAEKREAKKAKLEAKAAAREEKRAEKAAIKKVRDYHEDILIRRASIGGFAGGAILILSLAMLAIPAMSTRGSFETIPVIEEKLEYYRNYVTALLMGDDPALDILAFEGDANNFSPRNTTATPRYYTHEPLMTVESNSPTNIYLRGWIATSYEDGVWMTARPNSELLDKYRSLYATNDDASESIFYNFFRIMTDDGLFDDDVDVTSKLKRVEKYGYHIAQVNIKREEEFVDNILYMPSFHIRSYSPNGHSSTGNAVNFLRAFGSSEAGQISYANYFDGLYTSYRAGLNGTEGYAMVSMLPVLKHDTLEYNLGNLITDYNKTRAAIANGRETVFKDTEDERLSTFSVTLYDGSVIEYDVLSIAEDGTKVLAVAQPVGTALYTLTPDGEVKREMIDVPVEYDKEGNLIEYFAPKLDRAVLYFEQLDDVQQWQFRRQGELLDKYTPFVYETYTGKANSQIISDLYKEIVANAVVKEDYKEPVPADFSLAAQKSEYKYNKNKEVYQLVSTVTDRNVYVQRHALVMEIINYLCDEEKFTYTLNPTVLGEENTLDGVETFLTKTREGYCVQFASSLALLLREAGIPARYVEGYIATGLFTNRGDDAVARYKTTVRDSSAHAWVEVWYDGLGWIQYEATPKYYDAMYLSSRPSSGTSIPSNPGDYEDEEEEDPFEGMTEYEIEQMLEEQRREALRELIKKIVIITSCVLLFAAAVIIFFAVIIKKANKRAEAREMILLSLHEADEELGLIPERADVRKVCEMIMDLLRECGFVPGVGEFSADFAKRIATECERELVLAAPEEGMTEFEAPRHPMREKECVTVFEAIAAEEFGNGAPVSAMPSMAKLCYRLRSTVYKRKVSVFRRAIIYLFKKDN